MRINGLFEVPNEQAFSSKVLRFFAVNKFGHDFFQ